MRWINYGTETWKRDPTEIGTQGQSKEGNFLFGLGLHKFLPNRMNPINGTNFVLNCIEAQTVDGNHLFGMIGKRHLFFFEKGTIGNHHEFTASPTPCSCTYFFLLRGEGRTLQTREKPFFLHLLASRMKAKRFQICK